MRKSTQASKNPNTKFTAWSPYALFIDNKVKQYWENSKVKVDHKFLFTIFKVWQTLSKEQKKEYIDKFK